MGSKYVDTTSVMQIIGCAYNDPSLLELEDKYVITEEDFVEQFHRVVFGSIYNLYKLGAQAITLETINDYLSNKLKSQAIYQKNKGDEWVLRVSESATPEAFDYYYSRLKKFSLLRAYDNIGVDVTDIYDIDNFLDTEKKQKQEEQLNYFTLEQIATKVNDKIEAIRLQYVEGVYGEAKQAGSGIFDLITKFKNNPEVGVPLYGPLINTVTRGARLKKFYLRSAATGIGKTRSMIADACYIACSKMYDENFGWMNIGISEPVLFITTEQELEEIQTMMLAFLSNVNEEHILNGEYLEGEEERVGQAAEILAKAPLYVEELPDFSLQDVENTIKKNIRDYEVKYVFNPIRVGTV